MVLIKPGVWEKLSNMKKILQVVTAVFLCISLISCNAFSVYAEETEAEKSQEKTGEDSKKGPEIQGTSAIVMESSTGKVIYEKEADRKLPPASVTKIMTLLLVFDAISDGKIRLSDEVTVSEYAASMGGSQVFLEPGEVQTVETMIKCIAVASANDACVAMAEMLSGTEEAFVGQMNERAKGLGMENTRFENCNGLDTDGHLTTARDIALMSRELTTRHPEIFDYTKIWMEDIIHKTKKGEQTFGLSNTNRLLRQYEYATGLKTGSTGKAKFCLSATATKNDVDLIAVVMAEPDSKTRVKDSIALLNYGFSRVNRYQDDLSGYQTRITVSGGEKERVAAKAASDFTYVDLSGADLSGIEKKIELPETVKAPVTKHSGVGRIRYYLNGEEIGAVKILASETIKKLSYETAVKKTMKSWSL